MNVFDLEVVCKDGKVRLEREEIPRNFEPSGLWACWFTHWAKSEIPAILLTRPGSLWESAQLPADMTAAEIARLTVGDCRRIKGEDL